MADDLSHKAAVKAISTDLDKFWKKLITLNPQPTWDQFYQLAAVHCGVESSSKLDTARLRKRLDPSSTMKLPSFANIYLVIQDADLKKFFSKYLIDSSTASLKINNGVAEAAGSVNKFLGYVKKKINGDSAIGNREKDKPWTRKQLLILAAIVVVLIILISIIIAVSVANNGSNKQSTQLEVNTLSSSTSNANPAITNTVTTDPSIFPPESQCLSENVNVAIFSGIYGSEGYSDGLLGTGNYKEAVALASPSTGKFYVSDLNRFRQIDSAGTVSLLGSFPSNIRVASIAVGNSSIYVGYMGPSNNNRLIVTVTLNPFRYNYLAGSDTSNPSFRDGLNGAFGSIKTVFYDARHNRLLVSDSVNHLIRAVSFNGEVSTVYGKKRDSNSGGMSDDYNTTAEFKSPDGIAQDSKGNLYIADTGNNLLRKIHLNGYVSTVAGTVGLASSVDGGYGYNTLNSPTGLYVDSCDNVFILETGGKLRMLSPNGRLYTVPFVSPSAARSITGDSTGALFIASTSDEVILKVTFE